MKKGAIRFIALFLAIITLIPLLVACKQDGEAEVTTPTEQTTVPVEEAEPLEIIKNGVTEYEIIYPKGCEPSVSAAATQFRGLFQRLTGVEINTTNDSRTEDTVEKKIIIGKTKHEVAQNVFADMKYYDYRVIVDGSNIIIAALSEDGYSKVIEYLKDNLLSKVTDGEGGKELTMKAENYIASDKTDYQVSSWKINGNELGMYKIIYADKKIEDLVIAFRDDIAKKCGYVIEAGLDTKTDVSDYEILIGDTNRPESKSAGTPAPLNYFAKEQNGKLVIKSGGEHSLPKLLATIYRSLTKGKTEVVIDKGYALSGNFFDDPLDSSKPADSDLRIMSCNILAEFESWTANAALNPYLPVSLRKEILYAALDYYQPTVVGFQEMTMNWYAAAEEYSEYAEKWEILKFKNPQRSDGEYVFSTIMYRKDLYTLVDSGMKHYSKHNNARCRCYTWAILKDKESGQEFCFVSTHWDGSGREHGFLQVAELTEFVNTMKKRCPVFTTGDFNANEITDEFKKYLADADIMDAKYDTKLQVNNIGSWHNFTKTDISWGSCDHITATKDTTILKYQSLWQNDIYLCSDHCWLIADIKFN